MTLREQVAQIIAAMPDCAEAKCGPTCGDVCQFQWQVADAVLVVVAERERLLRERIEALEPPHDYVGLNAGRVWYEMRAAALGVFDDES